jgi:hypothetical protein
MHDFLGGATTLFKGSQQWSTISSSEPKTRFKHQLSRMNFPIVLFWNGEVATAKRYCGVCPKFRTSHMSLILRQRNG